jgi:hypothetical protein
MESVERERVNKDSERVNWFPGSGNRGPVNLEKNPDLFSGD